MKDFVVNFLRSKDRVPSAPFKQKYMINNRFNGPFARGYRDFACQAFMGNIVASRGVGMIAKSAASVALLVHDVLERKVELVDHEIVRLLKNPSNGYTCTRFIEEVVSHYLLAGNAYFYVTKENNKVTGMHILRPDRVTVEVDQDGRLAYIYNIDGRCFVFSDHEGNLDDICHFKSFHPLSDVAGMSSLQPAIDSIEQHNQCIKWGNNLLQNGARPSGAIVVKNNGQNHNLTNDQFERLKDQIQDQVSGSGNVGKVLILEGGLEWQEMGVNPKDMDFMEMKNSAARDIALSLGVPPQMLGIKGDSTYNNMAEARVAFWEETVLPLLSHLCSGMSVFLSRHFKGNFDITYDSDKISALSNRRQVLWDNVKDNDFLKEEEKRDMLGFSGA